MSQEGSDMGRSKDDKQMDPTGMEMICTDSPGTEEVWLKGRSWDSDTRERGNREAEPQQKEGDEVPVKGFMLPAAAISLPPAGRVLCPCILGLGTALVASTLALEKIALYTWQQKLEQQSTGTKPTRTDSDSQVLVPHGRGSEHTDAWREACEERGDVYGVFQPHINSTWETSPRQHHRPLPSALASVQGCPGWAAADAGEDEENGQGRSQPSHAGSVGRHEHWWILKSGSQGEQSWILVIPHADKKTPVCMQPRAATMRLEQKTQVENILLSLTCVLLHRVQIITVLCSAHLEAFCTSKHQDFPLLIKYFSLKDSTWSVSKTNLIW